MLERSLIAFSLLGAEWVLYLLVALSVTSVAIMIERAVFYAKRSVDVRHLSDGLATLLDKKDVEGARKMIAGQDSMEAHVVREGLAGLPHGADAVREIMAGELVRQRARFEERLIFLGTLGNNAPFVGLLGTVLGIIKAFRDLSLNDPSKSGASAQVVMAGISEALVATAVGLAVALPAVVAFNYFKSVVKAKVANTEGISRVLTTYVNRLTAAEGR
jgi:biopolymer transport protein ExbB